VRRDPSTIFGKLGNELQLQVLSFMDDDVPRRLQALLATPYKELVEQRDEIWRGKLKALLEDKFDLAFHIPRRDNVVPISKRPNWNKSTEFRAWYNECMQVEEPVKLDYSVQADTVASRTRSSRH
jgi:hypothetical protein